MSRIIINIVVDPRRLKAETTSAFFAAMIPLEQMADRDICQITKLTPGVPLLTGPKAVEVKPKVVRMKTDGVACWRRVLSKLRRKGWMSSASLHHELPQYKIGTIRASLTHLYTGGMVKRKDSYNYGVMRTEVLWKVV